MSKVGQVLAISGEYPGTYLPIIARRVSAVQLSAGVANVLKYGGYGWIHEHYAFLYRNNYYDCSRDGCS